MDVLRGADSGNLIVVGKALFVLSRMIVKYYIDPAESYSFAVISISVSFTVSMICLLMVPIDVFVTSHPVSTTF